MTSGCCNQFYLKGTLPFGHIDKRYKIFRSNIDMTGAEHGRECCRSALIGVLGKERYVIEHDRIAEGFRCLLQQGGRLGRRCASVVPVPRINGSLSVWVAG